MARAVSPFTAAAAPMLMSARPLKTRFRRSLYFRLPPPSRALTRASSLHFERRRHGLALYAIARRSRRTA